MAPSSWGDGTTTITATGTTYSTTSTYYENTSSGYYTFNWVDVRETEEYEKKLKEIIRKAIIQKMKDSWQQKKKEFKPISKVRPAAQLRGVCFSGRGWA